MSEFLIFYRFLRMSQAIRQISREEGELMIAVESSLSFVYDHKLIQEEWKGIWLMPISCWLAILRTKLIIRHGINSNALELSFKALSAPNSAYTPGFWHEPLQNQIILHCHSVLCCFTWLWLSKQHASWNHAKLISYKLFNISKYGKFYNEKPLTWKFSIISCIKCET